MTRSSWCFAALSLVSLAGCYDSFDALSADGGSSDAPEADARLADARLADARLADAGFADAGSCSGDVQWIDSVPNLLEADPGVPFRLLASSESFEFFYQNTNPTPCDGPCPMLMRLPTRGEPTLRVPAYWASTGPDQLFAGFSVGGEPAFAVLSHPIDVPGPGFLTWILGAPVVGGTWLEGQTVDLAPLLGAGDLVADLAFIQGDPRLYVASHQSAIGSGPGPMFRYDAFALREFAMSDTLTGLGTLPVDPFSGHDHWDARLPVNGTKTMIAGLQDVDFPTEVVARALTGAPFDLSGSSCGVDAYDFVPFAGDEAAVVQGCNATLEIEYRISPGPRRSAVIASDRFAELSSPVALREDGAGGFVAAYWASGSGTDGTLALVHVSASLEVLGRSTVPGPSFFWAETSPGPLSVALHADGTFAVAWNTSEGRAAVQRFTLGCD